MVLGKVILMGNENKTGVMITGRSVETRLYHDKYLLQGQNNSQGLIHVLVNKRSLNK